MVSYITQSGLRPAIWASRFGISRGYLSDIMSGKKRPGLDLAFRIERETKGGVPASSWVSADGQSTPSEDAA